VKNSNQSWPQVRETAKSFEKGIKEKWPRFHQELQGIADGSKRDILDIIALNVRTEIAFGQFMDGCTSLYWKTPNETFLGQNWDWMEEQKQNLIVLTIIQEDLPTIKMITEAGIMGKIGLNSSGVGVCFNAIKAKGLDASRMPVHLGLRTVLESNSAKKAVAKLESVGMASSAHMLIGDASNATGLEFTSIGFAKLPMDERNRVIHSNHLLAEHPGVIEPDWLKDSPIRVEQMMALTEKTAASGTPSWKEFSELFEDQTNFPAGICRAQEGVSGSATLFNIVMELKEKRAVIKMGRPCQVEETVELSFV